MSDQLTEKKAQVLMVVCDYIERRFQKRASSSNEVDELTKIETCIIKHKTKLNASLARFSHFRFIGLFTYIYIYTTCYIFKLR